MILSKICEGVMAVLAQRENMMCMLASDLADVLTKVKELNHGNTLQTVMNGLQHDFKDLYIEIDKGCIVLGG